MLNKVRYKTNKKEFRIMIFGYNNTQPIEQKCDKK